jgi:nucleoside-diphosphate-sugar epimerase
VSATHTILGANGAIGRALSPLLRAAGHRVRQVARQPQAEHPDDERFVANLLDAAAVGAAVAGSDVAYLLAGLRYDHRVWAAEWPVVMQNAIEACRRHGCRLVFFDNVYAYGRVEGVMTEETPYNPCSRKGEVRARIAAALMDAVRRGDLTAMIVRAADFYGPGPVLGVPNATILDRLRANRTPQWIGDPRAAHSFTYTLDAARTVARLAARADAYGQVWHALTSREPMSGERFARLACEIAGRPYRLQAAPRWLLRAMGMFQPVLRENLEMLYQFEYDYRFDSGKAEQALGEEATPYRDGIQAAMTR